ncbi:MAG: cell division protein FtsQ/DivIB [Nodosilinea sp.]
MTNVSPVSSDQIKSRRQSLRRQRRWHIGQALWRFLALSGLTTAVFWGATRPVWLIQSPRQINVTGNEHLSDAAVQDLIPLEYPQPLLKVEPETLARQLRDRAPVESAEVTRQLLPPRLNVRVQERVPVAVVVLPPGAEGDGATAQYLQAGLIDAQGAWIPQASFILAKGAPPLPTLHLRGMQPQYQRYWPQVYETIRASPVAISEIDWRDPGNLVLQTELGVVYLGAYTPELNQQLAALDKMRNLPNQLDGTKVAHIDLTNPDMPSVAVVETSPSPDNSPPPPD